MWINRDATQNVRIATEREKETDRPKWKPVTVKKPTNEKKDWKQKPKQNVFNLTESGLSW